MRTLKFAVKINAPKEKVWGKLWNDTSYRQWTSAFSDSSYAVSDWNEGSKILFLTPNGEGMYGIIEKKIPNEQMVFRHLGEVRKGIEETKDWGESIESYRLEEKNGITELNVEMSATPEFEKYFNDTFPKALEILKQISEH